MRRWPRIPRFSSCKEQVVREAKPVTIKETVATVRQNRPLLILCVSNLGFLTGIFGLQASQAYFAAYILGNSTQLIWMVVATSLAASLPRSPMWMVASARPP